MTSRPLSVVLADDDDLLRDGLSYLIEADGDLQVIGHARDGRAAVIATEHGHPDVVVMDIRMPILDGLEATRQIKAMDDPPAVLVLTVFGQDDYVVRALRNGADGFLLKRTSGERLRDAIRTVADGHALVAPELTRRLIDRHVNGRTVPIDLADTYGLTDREIDVLAQLAAGDSNEQIARHLGISDHTVKTHLSSLFAKTGCASRLQAVIFAYDTGLAVPQPRAR